MALLNLISTLALCFLPHAVYYHATPLAEFGVLRTVGQALFFNVLTSALKVVLLACLLPGTEITKQDIWQDLAQLFVGLADLLGLYLALTRKWSHKSISNEHRFQAVGLGWAFGDSLLRRLAPMWLTGFTPEFSMNNVIEALRSNIVMIHSIAFAAIGSLVFNKRIQTGPFAVLLKIILLFLTFLPFLFNFVEHAKGWTEFQALGFEALITFVSAMICWELNTNAQKKTS